ncbi:MAG: hypothetical protein HY660_12780, partial [Armatimonadetes bacterium]|nr:hypothetical protein [Armatimonadota bacterium]
LWTVRLNDTVLSLAMSRKGGVLAAATPDAVHLLQAADGKRLARLPYGPSQMMATVAISGDGGHIALGWKRPDGKALVAFFTRGRPKPVWEQVVGEGCPRCRWTTGRSG